MRFSPALIIVTAAAVLPLLSPLSRAAGPKKEQTALGEQMDIIGKAVRTLRRQIADPAQKDATLQLLAQAEESARKAKDLTPAKAKDVPEADREKFVAAYRDKAGELVTAFQKMEEDVRVDKFDAAKDGLAKLQDLKRKGHEQFSSEK